MPDSDVIINLILKDEMTVKMTAARAAVDAMSAEERQAAVAAHEHARALTEAEATSARAAIAEKESADSARDQAEALREAAEAAEKESKAGANVGMMFTEMKSKLDLAKEGLGIFVGVFQQAMAIGKEGAALATTNSQFDALSMSIGTTADSLSGRLDAAMGGTVSRADMLGSAVGIMNLKLATSEDEVVRLSTVSTKLGWDMGIVTLTLANLSTARLDSLGLAMEDVTVRAAELEAQGRSAGEAFKLAVLEGGEAKLKLLGDASTTMAGSFARLEASTKNLADSIMARLAPSLATAAEAANTLITWNSKMDSTLKIHSQEVARTSDSYDAYIAEMQRAYAVTNQIVDTNGAIVSSSVDVNGNILSQTETQVALTKAQWESIKAVEAKNAADADATKVLRAEQQEMRAANEAMGLYNETMDGGAASQKTFSDFAAVATAAVASQKSMLVGITSSAIALTDAENKRAEVEDKLSKLNADIAKSGPVRRSTIQNEKLSTEELVVVQAKLAVEKEKLSGITRGAKESQAEFNLRVIQAQSSVAELSNKMGEHTAVVGGATEAQLKERDALKATLDQMQRAAEIDAAKSAFAALGEALTKGVLSQEDYRSAMLAMNDATGMFSDTALKTATDSALMVDGIRKAKVPEEVIGAMNKYGDALGVTAQRSLEFTTFKSPMEQFYGQSTAVASSAELEAGSIEATRPRNAQAPVSFSIGRAEIDALVERNNAMTTAVDKLDLFIANTPLAQQADSEFYEALSATNPFEARVGELEIYLGLLDSAKAKQDALAGGGAPGSAPSATPTGVIAEYAGGGSFIVPPGYPRDSYRVGLTSGERVSVTPPGAVQTNNSNVTINVSDPLTGKLVMDMFQKNQREKLGARMG